MTDKILINSSRVLLGGLILYELLNQLEILNHPLTFTWLGLIITSGSIWLMLEAASFYTRKNFDHPLSGLAMIIAVAVVYLDALGDIFQFYTNYGWYDRLGHFVGGAAAAGLIFSFIKLLSDCQRRKTQLTILPMAFFAWTTAVFLGVLYELEEYFEDVFTGSQRFGNAFDTGDDLFLNLSGALLAALISAIYVYYRGRPAN
ncbi:MAG: hypothetical protein HY764_01565 [Candidatus Portnoybacteria bacterium]|nr:hypothetical protein [Candidatus Portnoybacteria bacterium]